MNRCELRDQHNPDKLKEINQISKFFEQIYNKQKHKILYHISDKNFDSFKLSHQYGGYDQKYPAIFLTPDIEFAIEFFKFVWKDSKRAGYLYTCHLTDEVDLFNPSSQKDLNKLEKFLTEDEYYKVILELSNVDNKRDNMIVECQKVIEFAGDSDYDGINTFGYFPNSDETSENIALFSDQYIKIIKKELINIHNPSKRKQI